MSAQLLDSCAFGSRVCLAIEDWGEAVRGRLSHSGAVRRCDSSRIIYYHNQRVVEVA